MSDDFNRNPNMGDAILAGARTFDEGLRTYMQKVFSYMAAGLGLSGATAYAVANITPLQTAIFGNPVLVFIVMLSPLAFIFFLGFRARAMTASQILLTFLVFSTVMGLSLSTIFLSYTTASITSTFFICAGMFAATALYGYATKRDLTGVGGFMVMGLLGIIIAGVVNMFIMSSALQFAISVIGVIVFTGLTAYDMQRIKESYAAHYGDEANNKMAVMGALSMYLNFINLFQSLLHLLGNRN
jgi:FtsH-binding integral membrane protein